MSIEELTKGSFNYLILVASTNSSEFLYYHVCDVTYSGNCKVRDTVPNKNSKNLDNNNIVMHVHGMMSYMILLKDQSGCLNTALITSTAHCM